MSVETLSASAGILLSVLFSYCPGLSTWYNGQDGTRKRLVMLGSLAAVALGALGLSCLGVQQAWQTPLPACSLFGLQAAGEAFVLALVANQAAYLISPK